MTANCIIFQPAASQAAAAGLRRCQGCRKAFASGGSHERVCPRCKESEIWQASICEYAVHPQSHPRGEAE
jgi:phage FluMu protein Com